MIVILGPTSSGKTSLSIQLSQRFDGEIISADSRQVFRFMDVGTGKIPQNEEEINVERSDQCWVLDHVKIWGYDLVNPDENFSVYDFGLFGCEIVQKIRDKKKEPFLVGGTGFYIDFLTGRVKLSGVKPNYERRKILERTPTHSLLKKLNEINPTKYEQVDKKNRRRIIRALEIEFDMEKRSTYVRHTLEKESYLYIGLSAKRAYLYMKVDAWVEKIFDFLVVEVKELIRKGYKETLPMKGLIYSTAVDYVEGMLSKENAIQRIKYDLHHYIRRQETWFRRNKNIKWIDISRSDAFKKALNLVESYLVNDR